MNTTICLLAVVAVERTGTDYFALLTGGHRLPITDPQGVALIDYLEAKNDAEINHVMADYEGLDEVIAMARGADPEGATGDE